MRSQHSMYQLPDFLKLGMYLSEMVIVNILFYSFFMDRLQPNFTGPIQENSLFVFVAMALTISYVAGVAVRPISFFYRSDRRGSIVGNVFSAVSVMALVFWLQSLFFSFAGQFQTMRIGMVFASIFASLVVWRFLCRRLIRNLRSMGRNAHQVIFVGNNESVVELYSEMRQPFYGYHVRGYFSDESLVDPPLEMNYLGRVEEVVEYIEKESDIQQLYCSLPAERAVEIRRIIDACEHNCVHFFTIPQLRIYLKRKMQLEVLGSVPVLYIREDPLLSLTNRFVKRSFDIVFSLLVMIPFWLIIFPIVAVLTYFLQPGPIFFKQKRNGKNGEEFYCYKFRSMKENADSDKVQATKDDPRKTPFGNFLRKTSIDELPQFINVLKGEMSVVGPRPHMVAHTEEYSALIDKYMVRHWVRPGITGWAQVTGARGETKELSQMEKRIQRDVWYVENWSFALDLKIIFLTVWNVIRGDKQAY